MHTKHRHEHRSIRSELYFAALSLSRRTDLPPRSGTHTQTNYSRNSADFSYSPLRLNRTIATIALPQEQTLMLYK